jgi:hypothetical protein
MNIKRILPLLLFCLLGPTVKAIFLPPPEVPVWLDYWSFWDTNTWLNDLEYPPVSFTNISSSNLGSGNALVVDSASPAWLQYNVQESDGTTNLTVNQGTLMFWFAPSWSGTNEGGTGPGQWGRLLEAGSYTTNASYGWWSVYVDAAGANLYFGAQTNGAGAVYLSAPISWTTNRWHNIAITYSATNSTLYFDGEFVTNGYPVTYWPGPNVLTNGFFIGSDSSGLNQARGMYDEMQTYDYPLDANMVLELANSSALTYWGNPENPANYAIGSAGFSANPVPGLNAITGSGFLQSLGATADCVSSSNVWLTNMVSLLAGSGTNVTANVTMSIQGGSDGFVYDVFANAVLGSENNTNYNWAWMGQGEHCNSYMITNLPMASAFVILGTPLDSDFDGLTDAFEKLISKTDPYNPDTDGDGISDGEEVLNLTDPLTSNPSIPAEPDIETCPQ